MWILWVQALNEAGRNKWAFFFLRVNVGERVNLWTFTCSSESQWELSLVLCRVSFTGLWRESIVQWNNMNHCDSRTRGPFSLARGRFDRDDVTNFSTSPADLIGVFFRETLLPMNWLNERWLQIGESVVNLRWCSTMPVYIVYRHDTFTSGWWNIPDWSETQIEAMMVFFLISNMQEWNLSWPEQV